MSDDPKLLFEDMIRVETLDHICRIWRQVPQPFYVHAISNEELKVFTLGALRAAERTGIANNLTDLVTVIVGYQNVNSVEVINRHSGCGICVHKDWP